MYDLAPDHFNIHFLLMIDVDSAGQAFAKIISKALPLGFFTRLVPSKSLNVCGVFNHIQIQANSNSCRYALQFNDTIIVSN